MAFFLKLFNRKPPDGLLEICDRVFVFDCCFSIDSSWEEDNYKVYMAGVVNNLQEHFPDASSLVFNFREVGSQSVMANLLSEYGLTIMDYPRHYEGCSLLPVEVMHHFLRSSESWLSLGPRNLLLMHCERGAWPVLAFMLAALLIYRKQYSGEDKALEMIYKQAPNELLHLFSPLNPIPSQLRYLQYVSRRNLVSEWPPLDRALTMDCVILRLIPDVSGQGGFRPIFRVYGQDPFLVDDKNSKLLYSTPKKGNHLKSYKQTECELVRIDINCNVQGDIVIECLSLDDDMEKEFMLFRVVFNTAFIRSNILMLNHDEVDTLWHMKGEFPKEFRAELIFSDMDAAPSVSLMDFPCLEEEDGLPMEAFSKVHEIFDEVDLLDQLDAKHNMLQDSAIANAVKEIPDGNSSPRLQDLSSKSIRDIMEQAEIENRDNFKLLSMSELETDSVEKLKEEDLHSVHQISNEANTTSQDATKLLHQESLSPKLVNDAAAVEHSLIDYEFPENAKENILESPPPENNVEAVSPSPSTPHLGTKSLTITGAPPPPLNSEQLQHIIVEPAEIFSQGNASVLSLPVSTFHQTTSDKELPMTKPATPPPENNGKAVSSSPSTPHSGTESLTTTGASPSSPPAPTSEQYQHSIVQPAEVLSQGNALFSLPVSTYLRTTSDIELPMTMPATPPPASHSFLQESFKPHVSKFGPEER